MVYWGVEAVRWLYNENLSQEEEEESKNKQRNKQNNPENVFYPA